MKIERVEVFGVGWIFPAAACRCLAALVWASRWTTPSWKSTGSTWKQPH